ncbi:trigger factor [Mesomycoplasma molare]|uniref:trigger factor n=1 Tax=Mesomycoplasma molare TaxID=171288 RepID=UPI00056AAC24|nr:trigger factor [Mesomycoplasma molare]
MVKREVSAKTSELIVKVKAEKSEWLEAQKKGKNKLIKNLQIPGFRKGKVPLDKAKNLISEQQIISEAANLIVENMQKIANSQIVESDQVLSWHPEVKPVSISKEEFELEFVYPIYPQFKLADYKTTGVEFKVKKVTKADINEAVDKLVKSYSLYESIEKEIKNGDIVTFDFKGFINDEPFEGGEAQDFELKIGSNNFIKGFEEAMIGFKKGDEKEIKVSFPKDYHAKEYAGKPAVFKLKIKDVKRANKIELNDQFVADLKIPNVHSVTELNKYYENVLTEENNEKAKMAFQKEIFDYLFSKTEFPVSSVLIKEEIKRVKKITEDKLKEQGFSIKEYAELLKINSEDLEKTFEAEALNNLKTSLTFAEISRIEKLNAVEEDYQKEYAKIAKLYGFKDTKGVEGVITREQLQIPIVNRKVIDRLIQYNTGKIADKIKAAKKTAAKKTTKTATKKSSTSSKTAKKENTK